MTLGPEVLIAFNLAIIGALISPGPAFIVLVQSSLLRGRHAGVFTGIGLACCAVFWSSIAMAGLVTVFELVPYAYLTLKILGGAYLVFLAIKLWRGAPRGLAAPEDGAPLDGQAGFWTGFIANVANPKAVFFIAAIFATLLPRQMTEADQILILANHLMLEVVWYVMVALALTTRPARAAYFRAKAGIDRIAALVLGGLAARIITT